MYVFFSGDEEARVFLFVYCLEVMDHSKIQSEHIHVGIAKGPEGPFNVLGDGIVNGALGNTC